jgi:hypothetical protein
MPSFGLTLELTLRVPRNSQPIGVKQPCEQCRWPAFEDERRSRPRPLWGEQMLRTIGGAVIEGGEEKTVRWLDLRESHILGCLPA